MSDDVYGKYGCWWEGGTGVSPDGQQCGECYPDYEDKCPLLHKEKQIDEMAEITKAHCELENQCGSCHYETCNDCFAEILYNAGYRKHSENTVEVVRCKDCKYCDVIYPIKCAGAEAINVYFCGFNNVPRKADDFCSYGEMKGGAE